MEKTIKTKKKYLLLTQFFNFNFFELLSPGTIVLFVTPNSDTDKYLIIPKTNIFLKFLRPDCTHTAHQNIDWLAFIRTW